MNVTTSNKRLLALDVMRGITIAGMILVNTPGSWQHAYAPLKHAEWIGLTPTDLVFPFFMFIMGISTYISLRKYNFTFSVPAGLKILKRTVIIFLIGIGISWLSILCFQHDPFPIDQIRILGVMQRLALGYGVTAIVALLMKHKYIPYLIAVLLISYFAILALGNGYVYDETNILSIVDRAVLGQAHIYGGQILDPEGLLSTISAIAHVLIGFCAGKLLMEVKDIHEKLERLFLIGTILTFAGFLLSYGSPICKKVWSPSFVLVTCGLGSSFLALLVWIIDIKGYKNWSRFFESFGVNPLFIYVLADILAITLAVIPMTYQGEATSLHGYIYSALLQPVFGDKGGSLVFALLFLLDEHADAVHVMGDNSLGVPGLYRFCQKHGILFYSQLGALKSTSNHAAVRRVMDLLLRRNLAVYRKTPTYAKTPAVAAELESLGVPCAGLMPVGLDTAIIPSIPNNRTEIRRALKIDEHARVFIFVGRLDPYKQPLDLVPLLQAAPDWYAIIIGRGSLGDELTRRLTDAGLLDRCRLIPQLPNEQVHVYYHACDAFVNLNPNEIFGMSLLEAMYAGCPPVARHAPGPDLIIENGISGLLCGTVPELAAALDKTTAAMGHAAQSRVNENFLWQNSAELALTLLPKKGKANG